AAAQPRARPARSGGRLGEHRLHTGQPAARGRGPDREGHLDPDCRRPGAASARCEPGSHAPDRRLALPFQMVAGVHRRRRGNDDLRPALAAAILMVAGSAPSQSKRDACPLPTPTQHRGPRVIVDWAKLVWCGMNESRSLGLAAQMAFWLFFSLLPLAAVGGLVLARIAVAHGDLATTMLGSTPPAVRDLVAAQLGQVARWNGAAVAPLAALVFVWLASSGIHAVFD